MHHSSASWLNTPWAQLSGAHEGRALLTFSDGGDIICYVPSTFLGFVFGEVAKIKITFVTFHVRCGSLSVVSSLL